MSMPLSQSSSRISRCIVDLLRMGHRKLPTLVTYRKSGILLLQTRSTLAGCPEGRAQPSCGHKEGGQSGGIERRNQKGAMRDCEYCPWLPREKHLEASMVSTHSDDRETSADDDEQPPCRAKSVYGVCPCHEDVQISTAQRCER